MGEGEFQDNEGMDSLVSQHCSLLVCLLWVSYFLSVESSVVVGDKATRRCMVRSVTASHGLALPLQ